MVTRGIYDRGESGSPRYPNSPTVDPAYAYRPAVGDDTTQRNKLWSRSHVGIDPGERFDVVWRTGSQEITQIVAEPGGRTVSVEVVGSVSTRHRVVVDRENLPEEVSGLESETLVALSFEFLLDRESNASILSRFALSEIEGYFPGYFDWLSHRSRRDRAAPNCE